MNASYPRETRIKAYELLDQGVPAKEVARRLKIQLNTIYAWSRTDKRAEFHRAIGVLNPTIAPRPRGRPPKALSQGYSSLAVVPEPKVTAPAAREAVSGHRGNVDLETENAQLRTENEWLRKLVDLYKEKAGV